MWGSRLHSRLCLMMNRSQSTNNSLSAEAFTSPCLFSQLPQHPLPQISLLQQLFLWMKYATAFAQAICSLLPCMLSSLHSIPTASSSSSLSAARLSSYRLDLQVPEHLRISVEPLIWLPYTSSVTLPGRLALSSFVNTFTPVPAISSIRPNHFPTCFRANCLRKSICYWSRTCSHPAFS